MKTYKDLIVWQKSVHLVVSIYKLTNKFPTEEKFGLTSQIRRSAISIVSNIAEGYGRRNPKENANFINIAYGSATELETQLIIAEQLNLIQSEDQKTINELLTQVLKLLYKYRSYLQSPEQ